MSTREMFFSDDIHLTRVALSYAPEKIQKAVRKELEAVNCETCHDQDCQCRNKHSRVPADAGGKSQCLRWAKMQTDYCWRNGDGTVIMIPPEVVEAIRDTD